LTANAAYGLKAYCKTCGKSAFFGEEDGRYDDEEARNRAQTARKTAALKAAGLKQCSVCKQPNLYYCSKECQKADWKDHKLVCGKAKAGSSTVKPAANSSYWYDRYVAEVGEEAAAAVDEGLGLTASQKKNRKEWWRSTSGVRGSILRGARDTHGLPTNDKGNAGTRMRRAL